MEKILEEIAKNRNARLRAFVLLGIFLGIQYADFRNKLNSIETRLSALESHATHVALK
jgi:hypothetical protein